MLTLRPLFPALAIFAACTARNDAAPTIAPAAKAMSLTVLSSGSRGFATPAARIDLSGVELRGSDASTRLTTTAFGHASAMAPAHAAAVDERDGRVTLHRGALHEWWRAVGGDLEFGYDVDTRPAGEGPLRIVIGASSDIRVSSDGIAAFLGELRVLDLHARDARGRELTARFVRDSASLAIEVDDSEAEYPLVIDPIVTSGTETKISTDASATVFGGVLALSPDGKHLISKRAPGASVVFFDEGPTGWTSPGAVTFPATESGGTEDYNVFGDSLAYYADGTALIPDYRFKKGGLTWAGAVFAYDPTPKYQALVQPTDNKADNQFGFSVASAGTSVIVGARSTSGTAAGAYVFTKSGTTFTQQAKLAQPTGSNYFGWTVAIDGDVALVGALSDHAFVFRRTGTAWSAGAEIKPTELVAADGFGTSFALGGKTLLLAATAKQVTTAGDGQVFVYRDTGTSFVREGVMFSVPPTGGAGGKLGSALAISSDGNTAYVGAPAAAAGQGRVFILTRTSGVWNVVRTLVPSDSATKGFGSSLALAGTRLAVGAPASTNGGLVYVYDPVLGVPTSGRCATALDCVSGFCVDGYCCDGACTAQCEACNVAGKEGKCSPVKGAPVGSRTACAAGGGTPECGNVCDGVTRNSCSLAGASFSCGTPSCDSKGMLLGLGQCDGAGACKAPSPTDCAPYRCSAGACATSCTLDTECADTARCVGGACVTGTASGDAGPPTIGGNFTECKADSECPTGFCADGVCCDQPCKDKCHSCAVPGSVGKCVPESGIDLRGDCDAKSCTTTCQAGVCRPIRSGDQCAPSLCIDEQTAQGPSTCSAAGSSCSAATGTQSCAPFKCALGACLTSCVTTAQCASGSVCDTSSQKCVTPAVEDDSGCAVGSGRGGASAALAILALAGLGLVRKRRR